MASLTTSVPFAWATSVDPKSCITYKKNKILVYLHVASKGEKHKKKKVSKSRVISWLGLDAMIKHFKGKSLSH